MLSAARHRVAIIMNNGIAIYSWQSAAICPSCGCSDSLDLHECPYSEIDARCEPCNCCDSCANSCANDV